MKFISLNVWGGELLDKLLNFIDEEAKTTDIFCFQEVLDSEEFCSRGIKEKHHLLRILKEHLLDFNSYFSPAQDRLEIDDKRVSFGLAIFVRKSIKVEFFDSVFIYRTRNGMVGDDRKTLPYNAQFLTILNDGGKITVANVHGLSDWPKIDTPARIKQSEIINEFLNKQHTSEIIFGDFNLFPDTESVKMLERGRKNLIREFEIENTRTARVPDPHVSDYCFTSSDIEIKSFSIPFIEISDHLPLILTIFR